MRDVYKSEKERAERRKIVTAFSVIYLAAIFIIIIILALTLSYDKVYAGITLNGVDVSGMSREELTRMIDEKYNLELGKYKIYFTTNNNQQIVDSISLKDLSIKYNTDAIVDAVYTPGHEGGMFARLSDILKIRRSKKDISLFGTTDDGVSLAEYEEAVISIKISEIMGNVSGNAVAHTIRVEKETSELVFISGKSGMMIDQESLKAKILEAAGNLKDTYLDLDEFSEKTNPQPLDPNQVYSTYNITSQNAKYARQGNSIIKVSEVNGQLVNISDIVSVIKQIEASPDVEKTYRIPVTFKIPDIKISDLPDPTFNDVIGTGYTTFGTGNANRLHNITLATSVVNGTILLPGEKYAFNDDNNVGDTTKDKGYKEGIGYEGENDVLTYGGGVCQVSTTLYLATINAGVAVDKRSNHSRSVGYVEKGLDAAVAYWGGKDLIIENNLNVPIMISGKVVGGKLTFQILGVNQNKGTKYTFSTSRTNTYTQNGKTYHVYTTYRTKTIDGKTVENKLEFGNKSTYLIPE